MDPLTNADSPCGGCQRLDSLGNDKAVTLITGHVVCSYCPAWREECMGRHNRAFDILALPKAERADALERHGEYYGELAKERLKAEVIAMHKRRLERVAG